MGAFQRQVFPISNLTDFENKPKTGTRTVWNIWTFRWEFIANQIVAVAHVHQNLSLSTRYIEQKQ